MRQIIGQPLHMQHISTYNNILWLISAVWIHCTNPSLNVLNHLYLDWKIEKNEKVPLILEKYRLTHFMTQTVSREQHTVAKNELNNLTHQNQWKTSFGKTP